MNREEEQKQAYIKELMAQLAEWRKKEAKRKEKKEERKPKVFTTVYIVCLKGEEGTIN